MKSDNYVVIQGWMCNELELKGNELLIYALIYGFSQDEQSVFSGSIDYIAETFNISKPTVIKAIQGLVDKDYIIKHETDNITQPNSYSYNIDVVKKLYYCSKETLPRSSKKTLLNNTSNNKHTNNTISKDIVQKPKKPSLYEKCVNLIHEFTDDAILQNMLEKCLQIFLTNSRESGYPFYTNTFKGKLNKLQSLSDDNYVQRKIVQQTADNGWNNFYEIKDNKRSKNVMQDVEHLDGLAERASKRGVKKSEQKF